MPPLIYVRRYPVPFALFFQGTARKNNCKTISITPNFLTLCSYVLKLFTLNKHRYLFTDNFRAKLGFPPLSFVYHFRCNI